MDVRASRRASMHFPDREFGIIEEDGSLIIYKRVDNHVFVVDEYDSYGRTTNTEITNEFSKFNKIAQGLSQTEAWDIFAVLTDNPMFADVRREARDDIRALVKSGRIDKAFLKML